MSSVELTFSKPWLLLLAIPSLLIVLLPFFRLPVQRRKSFRKIVPVVLHSIVVILLVLTISGFTVVKQTTEKAVMLVVDLSKSTKTLQQDMQTHAAQIMALTDPDTPMGMVVFGQDQIMTVGFTEDRSFTTAKVESDSTDIAGALSYASSQMPTDKAGHIILLSDGKQTLGDADESALQLAAQGIRLDAVYFDSTKMDSPEVQLTAVQAPDSVQIGEVFTVTATVESNTEETVTLSLYDGADLVQRVEQTITPGSTVVELNCSAETVGTHPYQLVLDPDGDTFPQNNEIYTYVKVTGEASVLIIADTLSNAQALAATLETDCAVATATAWNAPQSIVELCNYDEIILSNINATRLPSGYDRLLSDYVSVYGRSLLAVGGEDTFMYGGMLGSTYEEMLPVSLTLEDDGNAESVALMLVLDRSTSMIRNPMYLAVAKQGAIRCVNAMTGNDYIGVISFHSLAQVESPLVRGTENNKESVIRTISGLTTSNGTRYTDALELAHQGLMNCDAKFRHIIFLSDGQPSDRGYMEAVEKAAADGITVSTIGLGFGSASLQDIASTGNGRYYSVTDAAQLPDIMLSETKQVAVDSLITGNFSPVIARKSDLTQPVGDGKLPSLYGYLGTTLKDDAIAYITTEKGHPIYAQWSYGKGQVGCFTSDLSGNWSADWLSSDSATAVVRNIVSGLVDQKRYGSSLSAQLTTQAETTQITVTTADIVGSELAVTVKFAGNSKTYPLTATQPGIYTGSIPTVKAGVYELMVTQTDLGGGAMDYLALPLAVSYCQEYNVFDSRGEELLRTCCDHTGGQLYTDMQALAGRYR